jgi:hypothetical protein
MRKSNSDAVDARSNRGSQRSILARRLGNDVDDLDSITVLLFR